MNSFVCLKCNKEFKRKYNLERHQSRKSDCIYNKKVDDLEDDNISKSSNYPNTKKSIKYVCNYCNKEYKYRQGLYKHRQKCSSYINDKEIQAELNISKTQLTRVKDELFNKTVSNKRNSNAIKKLISKINKN